MKLVESADSKRNERLALQRSNITRFVAGHPGRLTREIAAGVRMQSQACGQVLHKNPNLFRKDERERWYLR